MRIWKKLLCQYTSDFCYAKNKTVRYIRASLLMNEIKRIEQLNDVDTTKKEFD